MGDTIPNCEFMHAHEEIIEKVNASMPDEELLYDLAELYKVFGDSTRIKILYVLFESEMCVCDIAQLLNMSQSAISHQLRVLKPTAAGAQGFQARAVPARGQNRFLFACGFSCTLHSCSGNGTRVRINGRNKD